MSEIGNKAEKLLTLIKATGNSKASGFVLIDGETYWVRVSKVDNSAADNDQEDPIGYTAPNPIGGCDEQ